MENPTPATCRLPSAPAVCPCPCRLLLLRTLPSSFTTPPGQLMAGFVHIPLYPLPLASLPLSYFRGSQVAYLIGKSVKRGPNYEETG